MQSASDTSRFELEWEISNNLKIKGKYERILFDLEKAKKRKCKHAKVEEGSLVQIGRRGKVIRCLVLEEESGMEINLSDGKIVYAVSQNAPIFDDKSGLNVIECID